MNRFLQALFAVLAGVMLAGAADSSSTAASPEVEAGRKLYLTKCARCHKFYNPANYSDAKWNDWMEKMSKKAKLKPDQKILLSDYLETFRRGLKSNEKPHP